ncbi:hypothetical protein [Bacillus sp. B15-48]|uniref:hypothetical protein n=1 Tax=Bacillus sp. B15-48 TaxID=1548601 RepID=UPI00193F9D9A|nr:hypothetical protein [Bacillus sp. B15-48]MBM4761742.1 hypothetical protein [Bacillus sp. B15-48]
MTENHQFQAMKSNWDNLIMGDFYKQLAAKVNFSKATDLAYVKEKVLEVVGKENEHRVKEHILPAILVTAFYYKTGRQTIILSKEDTKKILMMNNPYVDIKRLPPFNRCLFLKIADGLLTATDQRGNLLEVEGIYLLNTKAANQNALMVYSVFINNDKYGFQYLSFPYGNEGNLFDEYERITEAIGLKNNAFQSREILEFAVQAMDYLKVKGRI